MLCPKINDVYYTGTADEWGKITVGKNNSYLTSANIHFEKLNGTFGNNFTWTLLKGVLEISGEGDMPLFGIGTSPWTDYINEIKTVIIGDKVTSIGGNAFYDCTALKDVTIGSAVTAVYQCAFYNCTSLESVTLPDAVIGIGNNAFEK